MWPFKAKAPKSSRAYAAARVDRLTADWISSTTSQDAESRLSIRILRDRSRQLERDNDYIGAALRLIENNVIGRGINFQAQVKMQRGSKLNNDINDAIEYAFEKWARKGSCHTGGTLSFKDIERLVIRSIARDGDVLVRMIKRPFGKSKVPFALELIEADQLDDMMNQVAKDGQNEIRMGVERDSWGRPVAYHIREGHPGDTFGMSQSNTSLRRRIPAEEIIHLFVSNRIGQTRGIPWFHTAMVSLKHLNGYQEATIVKARAEAAQMGFIKTPAGEMPNDGQQNGDYVQEFSPGTIRKLNDGEDIVVPNMGNSVGNYDPFVRSVLRGISSGIGQSYESISKDYSQSNFSSSRLALADVRDNWKALQRWIVEQFHQPVFEAWLDMAVLSGELKLPAYETKPEAYQCIKWKPRGWSYIDPQAEIRANKEAIRSGMTTLTDVVSELGYDIEEVFQQRKRELELAEEMDLIFDTDPAVMSTAGQAQVMPVEDEAADDTAEEEVSKPDPMQSETDPMMAED
jgi:lambda family phage portal protein